MIISLRRLLISGKRILDEIVVKAFLAVADLERKDIKGKVGEVELELIAIAMGGRLQMVLNYTSNTCYVVFDFCILSVI